jgi:hypothetical protein
MMKRHYNVFVVMMFGILSDAPPSRMLNVQPCKRTPTTIVRPKSFVKKQIVAFLLFVILAIGMQLEVQ